MNIGSIIAIMMKNHLFTITLIKKQMENSKMKLLANS